MNWRGAVGADCPRTEHQTWPGLSVLKAISVDGPRDKLAGVSFDRNRLRRLPEIALDQVGQKSMPCGDQILPVVGKHVLQKALFDQCLGGQDRHDDQYRKPIEPVPVVAGDPDHHHNQRAVHGVSNQCIGASGYEPHARTRLGKDPRDTNAVVSKRPKPECGANETGQQPQQMATVDQPNRPTSNRYGHELDGY